MNLPWALLRDVFSIVAINLVLSGDNGLLIAVAVRSLPPAMRNRAVAAGAGCAVILQIIITFFAAQLLNLPFLRLCGGVLVIWIAIRLFRQNTQPQAPGPAPGSLSRAIWSIVLANVAMSTDNVLAVAGAAHGSLPLLAAGLSLSIPFVMFGSRLLVVVMDRYPLVVCLGAGILGEVGADMIMSDSFTVHALGPGVLWRHWAEAAGFVGILAVGACQLRTNGWRARISHTHVLRQHAGPAP